MEFYKITIPQIRDYHPIAGYDQELSYVYSIEPIYIDQELPSINWVAIYEGTITYDSCWNYNLLKKVAVKQSMEVFLGMIRKRYPHIKFVMDYTVEYHKSGRPHLHYQLFSECEFDGTYLMNIKATLCRKFGKTQLYGEEEDKYHTTKEAYWSQYIRKDLVKNSENGLLHGYRVTNNNQLL